MKINEYFERHEFPNPQKLDETNNWLNKLQGY